MIMMNNPFKRNTIYSYKSSLSLSIFTIKNNRLILAFFSMLIFDFFEIIKEDEVIKNYTQYTQTIYDNTIIIIITNASSIIQFSQLGIFSLLAYISNEKIKIFYHL